MPSAVFDLGWDVLHLLLAAVVHVLQGAGRQLALLVERWKNVTENPRTLFDKELNEWGDLVLMTSSSELGQRRLGAKQMARLTEVIAVDLLIESNLVQQGHEITEE